jgi:hypothetical protein
MNAVPIVPDAVVPVPELRYEFKIEVEAVALASELMLQDLR